MGEQAIGQQPVRSEMPKPEMGKAMRPDVVKIGDSERRMPEASRAVNIASATMEFLDDLRKANLVAKKELGELASTRIGKAIAVGAVGGGLEYLSEHALGLALNRLLTSLPSKKKEDMEILKNLLNSSLTREILEDIGVYALYRKGNEIIGNELPKVPVSYLGAAVGVNVLDWGARESFHHEKQLKTYVDVDGKGKGKNRVYSYVMKPNSQYKDIPDKDKKGLLDFIPRTAGKLADFSNPITLYGTAQVIEGGSAYLRAVRDIRTARKTGGENKVEMLLSEAKKAKPVGAKRESHERALDILERIVEDKGN